MSKTTTEIEAAYNRVAPLYDLMNQVYFLGRDKKFRLTLVERLNLKPGDVVLVLCCGTGLDFPFLTQKITNQGTMVGVDISSEMLSQAKKKLESEEANLVRSDAAHLPFRDKIFDAIFASFCLKIIPAHEKAIEEAARVLKPAGRIGVLANQKPSGPLRLLGIIITKLLSAMAKIDFKINLKEHLSKKFKIIEEQRMHGGLVQFLVGEKIS